MTRQTSAGHGALPKPTGYDGFLWPHSDGFIWLHLETG
jgi:hypothetical protein